MHCFVLFGNEEFAGAGVIKKCCCAKEKTHLMPLLLIPVGRWKATELFVSLQCQWKSHISEWMYVMCRTTGLFAPCNTPERHNWGWGSAALLKQPFLGLEAGGMAAAAQEHPGASCSACSGPRACAGHCCGHHAQHGRGNVHQASPAGSPPSHQTCHLS